MIGYVEGFEDGYCQIEVDGQIHHVKKEKIDTRVRPGDVVEFKEEKWIPNKTLTVQRTGQVKKLMDEVWED